MIKQSKIDDWCKWYLTSSRTEPTYKPKALLAVLDADGPRALAAVLEKLDLKETQKLIEAMREP